LQFFSEKQAETGATVDPGRSLGPLDGNPTGVTPCLDIEHSMNYVHSLFRVGVDVMVRAVVEEAATLASLALFLGMVAIWAQVIATL
jgi:hypothetical protein